MLLRECHVTRAFVNIFDEELFIRSLRAVLMYVASRIFI